MIFIDFLDIFKDGINTFYPEFVYFAIACFGLVFAVLFIRGAL